MAMRVKTTPLFERTLDKLLNCSNDYYSMNTIRAVYAEYKQTRVILSEQPYIGAPEPILCNMPTGFRRIVIKPYFKLIYTVVADEVYLVDLWDTRQSPDHLRSRID